MTLAASPAILAAIDELEAYARDYETKAGECRDAIAVMRKTFNVSTIVADASAPPSFQVNTFLRPKAGSATRRSPGDIADDEARIIEVIRRAGRPLSSSEIRERLQPTIVMLEARRHLKRLRDLGRVTMTGDKATARYSLLPGLTAVAQAPISAVAPRPPSVPPSPSQASRELEPVPLPTTETAVPADQ